MAVQFILGRAGAGKTRRCIAAIAAALREGGDVPLVLLVPEQATYQAEQAILSEPGITGYCRLQILSFERLRFRLCGGAAGQTELSRAGKQMVLQRILTDCRGRLKIFGGGARSGLAGKLADQIAELYHADLSPGQLEETAATLEREQPGSQTALKLADLGVIFRAYEEFLGAHPEFSDSDYLFCRFTRQMRRDSESRAKAHSASHSIHSNPVAYASGFCSFEGARLWVDGFSGFSGQEENLLLELLKRAEQSHIALCLDPAALKAPGSTSPGAFAPTEETYARLCRRIAEAGLTLREALLLTGGRRYHKAPALRYLEENFFDDLPNQPAPCGGSIVSAALPDVRGECLWIARQIRQLVRDEGLRYRDIAVVVPEMATYQHPLAWAMERMDLPYFLDRPRPLRTHPAAELLDSALRAVCFGFRLPDMTAYLKTGLVGLDEPAADGLDNYCRACGAEGSDWLREEPWDFGVSSSGRFDQAVIDRLRRQVIGPLGILRERLRISENEAVEPAVFVRAVWDFLEGLGVREALAERAAGDPTDQRFGCRQLWDKLVGLLNELCVIYAGTARPAADFLRLMQTAVATLTIKLIPPMLDQVLVGEIERSRHPDIQALFLAGVTQKQFPVPLQLDSLLGRDDRRALEPLALDFAESLEDQLLRRRYLSYIALTRAGRRITLTRPIADDNGSAIGPWHGLVRLCGLFSDLRETFPSGEPQRAEALQTEREVVEYVCGVCGRDSQATEQEKQMSAALLKQTRPQAEETVRQALGYRNEAVLEAGVLARIFSGPLKTSVSRLETFAACPYQFFASYILRLEKRRLVRLEPVDFGSFYHAALDGLFREIRKQRLDWRTLEAGRLEAICRQVIEQVVQSDPALQSYQRHSAHQAFVLSDASAQVWRLAAGLQEMIAAGSFAPLATEVDFGRGTLPALELPSAGGRPVSLRGIIDRIDAADVDGRHTALVFDYKSTSRSFSWTRWRHGLSVQMPAYLLALRGGTIEGKQIEETAGAFYIPILSRPKTVQPGQAEQESKRPVKTRGFMNGAYAQWIDGGAAGWSEYYNFYVDKEGSAYGCFSTSGAVRPEEFEALLSATKGILQGLAEGVLSGTIAITPYRLNRVSPCSWCAYRAVCKFDWEINSYRLIPATDKKAVLDTLGEGDS